MKKIYLYYEDSMERRAQRRTLLQISMENSYFEEDIIMGKKKKAIACLRTCYMPERHVDTDEQPQDLQDLQG